MPEIKHFRHTERFNLESGEYLPGFHLAYQTFGQLNEAKDNAIWVVHALTANSDPTEWWPGVVGPGHAIDPKKHFVICANSLASPYGSTHPLDTNPETNERYFHDFPLLTNRDVVKAFILLRKHLKLDKLKLIIGPSLGGQQCLEWAISEPNVIEKLCLIGTNASHSPWGIAFNESQRMAIEADQSWKERSPDAGIEGLKVARSIALLSYRTVYGYNQTQIDQEEKLSDFRASSYQRYQGKKLANRFNAFSYWYLSKMMDNHNVGRGKKSIEEALSTVKSQTTVVGLRSDILFPLFEQEFLATHIPKARLVVMDSLLGHDGFLTEKDQVSTIIENIINK